MNETQLPTPGGQRLKALRLQQGLTQLDIELDAELGTGYLQRLESGRVRQPVRSTLERILEAAGARYSERQEILELFGYMVTSAPPTEEERQWAMELSERELSLFPFPAYVLDCIHRLIAWNRVFPRLLDPNGEAVINQTLTGRSYPGAWFDPESPLARMLIAPDAFRRALVRAFRHEMHRFHFEPWYQDVIRELRQIPDFEHYWQLAEQEKALAGAARALVPVRLRHALHGEIEFRISAELFTRDSRFRIVYFFPANAHTMSVCGHWRGFM